MNNYINTTLIFNIHLNNLFILTNPQTEPTTEKNDPITSRCQIGGPTSALGTV